MEKDIKSKKTIALIAVFAISLVVLGAALFYSLRTPSNVGVQSQPDNTADQTQQPAGTTIEGVTATAPDGTVIAIPDKDNTAIYQGQTLVADKKYARGVLDGVIKKIDGNVISLEVDVKRIFPQSPVATKTVQVTVAKTAEVTIINTDGSKQNSNVSGLKVEDRIGLALVDGQSNRNIFDKDTFDAMRVAIFK